MSFTSFFGRKVLDYGFGGDTGFFSSTASTLTVYAGLSLTEPDVWGGGVTEPSGNGYARTLLTPGAWSAATTADPATISYNDDLDFPVATGAWGTCAWFTLHDAASAGNLIAFGALTVTKSPTSGDTVVFRPGDLKVQIFNFCSDAGWTPAALFDASQDGWWFEPQDAATIFTDSAGTDPANLAPIGKIASKVNSYSAVQATSTARPTGKNRTNLIAFTERFDSSTWDKFEAAVSANAAIGPNGGKTAYKIIESTSSSAHNIQQFCVFADNTNYTFSAFVKAAERSTCSFTVKTKANTFLTASFNLSTLSVSATVGSAQIIDVGNGWRRCSFTCSSSSGASTPKIFLSATQVYGVQSYTGDGVSGIYIWGAQLEQGTLTDYTSTTDYIANDLVDDNLTVSMASGVTGTLVVSSSQGTAAYGVTVPSGTFNLLRNTAASSYTFAPNFVGAVLIAGSLSETELARLYGYYAEKAGNTLVGDRAYGASTYFKEYWRDAAWLTSMPVIDTSLVYDFTRTWYQCVGLTSFPVLNFDSALYVGGAWQGCTSLSSFAAVAMPAATDFTSSWQSCTSLTSFPLIQFDSATKLQGTWAFCSSLATFPAGCFDNSPCTNYTNAFLNCALTQTSVDNILISINNAGTSNGTLTINGGTSAAPSSAGLAAKAALQARGWTVTTN